MYCGIVKNKQIWGFSSEVQVFCQETGKLIKNIEVTDTERPIYAWLKLRSDQIEIFPLNSNKIFLRNPNTDRLEEKEFPFNWTVTISKRLEGNPFIATVGFSQDMLIIDTRFRTIVKKLNSTTGYGLAVYQDMIFFSRSRSKGDDSIQREWLTCYWMTTDAEYMMYRMPERFETLQIDTEGTLHFASNKSFCKIVDHPLSGVMKQSEVFKNDLYAHCHVVDDVSYHFD